MEWQQQHTQKTEGEIKTTSPRGILSFYTEFRFPPVYDP